mgnify:CR=1 FL=1
MNINTKGYYRYPTVHNDTIVFVSEDDLWQVAIEGGVAQRLTGNLGHIGNPCFSPDGKHIAFTGHEDGPSEAYVIPATGGQAKRLTYFGNNFTMVVGWQHNKVLCSSNHEQPFQRMLSLYSIDIEGNFPSKLPTGVARNCSYGPDGGIVIGRNTRDSAYWKRYRGGTAGVLWIDEEGDGNFRKLIDLNGNFNTPMWIDKRIYFSVDHQGIANIYSCLPDGNDLQQHTFHKNYYVRNANTDGKHIVYHAGGDIYCFNIASGETQKVAIQYYSPRTKRNRKFADADEYFEDYDLNYNGSHVAITSRGKSFTMGNWEGAVNQQGDRNGGIRYRLNRWLNDDERIVLCSDESGEDRIEVHYADGREAPKKWNDIDVGRLYDIHVSPNKNHHQIVVTNHRQELIWIDLETGKHKVLDRGTKGSPFGLRYSISHDGNWVAYSFPISRLNTIIRLYQLDTDEKHDVTKPVLHDYAPCFDPCGKYLYFLSKRIFNPVYDNMHFDLNFPKGSRPYLITLQKDTLSPFVPQAKSFDWDDEDDDDDDDDDSSKKSDGQKSDDNETKNADEEVTPLVIDLENIYNRIVPFPVEEGDYGDLLALKDKVLYTAYDVEGAIDTDDDDAKASLHSYDLNELEEKDIVDSISSFKISKDGVALAYTIEHRLRIVALDKNLPKVNSTNRKGGWINFNRLNLSIVPPAEWQQMYKEAWRLQRDFFWVENMTDIDWKRVFDRYYPLIDRINSRSEFSDIMWEMQGELGTSHAYESGGDYHPSPTHYSGHLGASFIWNEAKSAYTISHIVTGDVWAIRNTSPLKRPGLNVQEGMLLLAVDGQTLSQSVYPQKVLVNRVKQEINLVVADADKSNIRTVTVKTMSHEFDQRYRDWVEANRARVHEASAGKVGYVHVPNMGADGFAEFHRYFLSELDYDGLVVDVRFNGGGHVSQLLLEKLARKRQGYDLTRWMGIEPYPSESPAGSLVALTNEHAGSDGDIFSHTFKLMQLGKLVGKRTWGGVIGIWPRNSLVDGSGTTQPEFSFWFKDVGWKVENYGTEPDIEVEITPQDYVQGNDPQLEKAIEVVLADLIENPPLRPNFEETPRLTLPN